MYTVGPHFAHGESRKSPGEFKMKELNIVVDGQVIRDANGKEVRKVLELTNEEKFIAYKVVKAFNQRICGFDLLRSGSELYVCDVNGWSFVKGNHPFYVKCSALLREMFLHSMQYKGFPFLKHIPNQFHLRGIISVFRHADRTPKQKLKIRLSNENFLNFFKSPPKEVKLKNDSREQRILLENLESKIYDLLHLQVIPGINEDDRIKLQLLRRVLQVIEFIYSQQNRKDLVEQKSN